MSCYSYRCVEGLCTCADLENPWYWVMMGVVVLLLLWAWCAK
ncbi:MAG: hypothetical protein WC307_06235 [Candidatus Nanoarchaeia archaeon]